MPVIQELDVQNASGTPTNWTIIGGGTAAAALNAVTDTRYLRSLDPPTIPHRLGIVTATDSLPANHERHRYQMVVRLRSEGGVSSYSASVWEGTGEPVAQVTSVSGTVGTTVQELTTGWATLTNPTLARQASRLWRGAVVARSSGSNSPLRAARAVYRVDMRARPTFNGQVRDGGGNVVTGGTVLDTTTPSINFASVSLDGLPARSWEVTVLQGGSVVQTHSGTGPPPGPGVLVLGPLENGPHTAQLRVSSTIRGNAEFPSAVETIAWTQDTSTPGPFFADAEFQEDGSGVQLCWWSSDLPTQEINYAHDPDAVNLSQWNTNLPSSNLSLVTGWEGNPSAVRLIRGPANDIDQRFQVDSADLPTNTEVTIRFRTRTEQFHLVQLLYRPVGPGNPAGQVVGTPGNLTLGEGFFEVTFTTSGTSPVDPTVGLMINNDSADQFSEGSTIDITEVTYKVGPEAGEFYSGSTPNTPGVRYEWVGDPNASATVRNNVHDAWDDPDDLVMEVQRSDCDGGNFETIHTSRGDGPVACWTDRFAPLNTDEEHDCRDTSSCCVAYRMRWFGLVDGFWSGTEWNFIEDDNPETMTNLIVRPKPAPGGGGWTQAWGTGGAGSVSIQTDENGDYFRRMQWSATPAGGAMGHIAATASGASYVVEEGLPYSARIELRQSRAFTRAIPVSMRVVIWFRDDSNTTIGTATQDYLDMSPNAWHTLTIEDQEAPEGVSNARVHGLLLNTSGQVIAGTVLDARRVMLVQDAVAPPVYWDGDTEMGGGYRYEWEDEADNSPSIRRAISCIDTTNPERGMDWLRGVVSGDFAWCPDRAWARVRPIGVHQGLAGGLQTAVKGRSSGRNYTLEGTIPENELELFESILDQPVFLYQPDGQRQLWATLVDDSYASHKTSSRLAQVELELVEVAPYPIPTVEDRWEG